MKLYLPFLFTVLLCLSARAQDPNDCVNAIVICGNGSFSSNASGAGVQEVSGCTSEEHNSIWIKVDIVQSGKLGFDIIPENTSITVDYDFWVYGPNEDCSSLTTPIRCSTTNPEAAGQSNNYTGLGDANLEEFEGPGALGDSYVEWLDVVDGESYYIVIDRPIGNGGFEINWTGSAAQGTGAFPEPPEANSISDIEICSNTGSAIFDLDNLKSLVNSDLNNNTVEFYDSLADAVDSNNPLANNYTSTQAIKTIYTKVTNSITGCTSFSEFNLIINQVKDINISFSENPICAAKDVEIQFSGTANAYVEFQIDGGTVQEIQLDSSGNAQITQFVGQELDIETLYTYVEDVDGNVTCSANQDGIFTVTIEPIQVGENLIDFYECDGDEDGKVLFNLTENDSLALGNLGDNFQVSYHYTQNHAVNGTNAITSPLAFENTQTLPQEIWVRVEDASFTDCNAVSSFLLDAYTDAPPSFEVSRSSLNFEEQHLITVSNITGIGTYEFRVDNGNWQPVDQITNTVTFAVEGGGQFTVTGRHTEGCGSSFTTVTFIDYPRFFTPNQDGINDTWNIIGLSGNNSNAEILIFDRFGKLLKSLAANSKGWDGTYHGKQMPSNDYWFLVKYKEVLAEGSTVTKTFKSNFSLIR